MNKKIAWPSLLLLMSASGGALASGFQLLEQGSSALGTAYAGTAVLADDATTVFSNPAGMSLLPQGKMNFAANLSAVKPSAKFSNQGSVAPAFQTLGSGDGGDAGSLSFLPSVYFAMPINDRFSFGIGVNAPFGLKTEYDSNWSGRFQGVKSDVETINVNPSVSLQGERRGHLGLRLELPKTQG